MPPTARPARGLNDWLIQPTIGPPTGVEPRNTMLNRASTRPRMAGSASTWAMAWLPEMTMNELNPRGSTEASASAVVGANVSAPVKIAMPVPPISRNRRPIRCWRATTNAPATEPRLITEYSSVNVPAEPWRSRSASSGSVTW